MSPVEETSGPLPAVVLLVEDERLIAMTAEVMLEEFGVADIRIAHTVADANAILDEAAVDLAILDYHLGRENSVAIAERLAAQGVHFAFASGARPDDLPETLAGVMLVTKPYTLKELGRILRA